MNFADIPHYRLINQGIAAADATAVAEVITRLGAMQAQDYPGAFWSIGLRMPHATPQLIEQAITDRTIIRTWPMRGTLHFVPAADARWMLDLMTPRVLASTTSRNRNLELDDATLARAHDIFAAALSGGKILTRTEMRALLESHGIAAANQRGTHILWHWAQKGLLCFGPHQGKEPTYVLLDEWVLHHNTPSRDEALATLAERYFTSHGPATERDFAWWSGLTLTDVRAALAMIQPKLIRETIGDKTYYMPPLAEKDLDTSGVYLLPGFDEYMLGYTDRSAALHIDHSQKVVPGNNGMFLATIVSNGAIAGTWKKTPRAKSLTVTPTFFDGFTTTEIQALAKATQRYGDFIGLPATLAV